jgi:hypothetical protein
LVLLLGACSSLPTGDDPNGIEGMSADAVVAALREEGLECSDPEKGLVHVDFACVETANTTGVNGRGTYVNELSGLEVYALDGDRETLERLARVVLSIPYQGSDPDAAMAWINERLDAGTCTTDAAGQDCEEPIGSALIRVSVGTDGDLEVALSGIVQG